MDKEALKNLGQFCGTEQYYQTHPSFCITDGVRFLCENAECFWLTDIMSSYQGLCANDEKLRDFQVWRLVPAVEPTREKLEVLTEGGVLCYRRGTEGAKAVAYAICERDTNDTAIVQEIYHTDFPFDAMSEVKLFVQSTVDASGRKLSVAMLPNEY